MSIAARSLRQLTMVGTIAFVLAAPTAHAQLAGQVPAPLAEVGVEEHLDAMLPLDATFTDEDGNRVTLGSFFDGERPVILTLNYYRCPMLCGLMLNGVADGFEDLEWTAGTEFEVVTISINPLETPALAREKKQNYLKRLGRPEAARGWHFLTGLEPQIDRVAEAVPPAGKDNESRQPVKHEHEEDHGQGLDRELSHRQVWRAEQDKDDRHAIADDAQRGGPEHLVRDPQQHARVHPARVGDHHATQPAQQRAQQFQPLRPVQLGEGSRRHGRWTLAHAMAAAERGGETGGRGRDRRGRSRTGCLTGRDFTGPADTPKGDIGDAAAYRRASESSASSDSAAAAASARSTWARRMFSRCSG